MVEQDDEKTATVLKPVLLQQPERTREPSLADASVIDLSGAFADMKDASQEQLRAALDQAVEQHRTLDAHLERLQMQPSRDMLEIARLKKTKLGLKDLITRLKARLVPDIIA